MSGAQKNQSQENYQTQSMCLRPRLGYRETAGRKQSSKGKVRGEDTEADSCGWEKGKKEIPKTRRQRRAEGPQVWDPRQSPARGQASPVATRAPGASAALTPWGLRRSLLAS